VSYVSYPEGILVDFNVLNGLIGMLGKGLHR